MKDYIKIGIEKNLISFNEDMSPQVSDLDFMPLERML